MMHCYQFNSFREWSVNNAYSYTSERRYGECPERVDCALNLSKDSTIFGENGISNDADEACGQQFDIGAETGRAHTHEPTDDRPLDLSKPAVVSKKVNKRKPSKTAKIVDKRPSSTAKIVDKRPPSTAQIVDNRSSSTAQIVDKQFVPKPAYTRRTIHCNFCPFTTNHKNNLRKHITGKHLEADNVECPKCGKMSKHKYALAVHLNYCGKERRFFCAYCPSKYAKRDHLQRHVFRKHVGMPVKLGVPRPLPLSSPPLASDAQIGYATPSPQTIEEQPKFNAKECPRCGREFSYWGHMQRHYKSCSGNTIQCDFCPYKAKDKAMLQIHVSNVHLNAGAEPVMVPGITIKTEPI